MKEEREPMPWNQYRDQYRDLLLALNEAYLITLVAASALKDFPKNAPESILHGMREALGHLSNLFKKLEDAIKSGYPANLKFSVEDDTSPIIMPFFAITNIRLMQGKEPFPSGFENALFQQQLVMLFAFIEAFIGDSIRAICKGNPQILTSSQKQVTWEIALSYPDRDSLFEFLTEEYVSATMRSKDVRGILSFLMKEYGLKMVFDAAHLLNLSLAEQVRHLIVHSGGKVDAKFLNKTNNSSLCIGDPFPIDEKFMLEALSACLSITETIFVTISKKFYGILRPIEKSGLSFKIIKRK